MAPVKDTNQEEPATTERVSSMTNLLLDCASESKPDIRSQLADAKREQIDEISRLMMFFPYHLVVQLRKVYEEFVGSY